MWRVCIRAICGVCLRERIGIQVAKKVTKKTAKKATAKKATAKKSKVKKAATKKKTQKKKVAKKKSSVKKVAAKTKSAGRKKVVRRRKKSVLTASEIEHFKEMLWAKRAELIGDVNYMENEALRKSRLDATGDLSSMPIHMADLGTDNFEQEFALGLMDSERKLLGEIHDALRRIDHGHFGICEGTGKPIAKARLEACPWARYSIEYATMVEKGLVIEGQPVYEELEEESEEDELEHDEDDFRKFVPLGSEDAVEDEDEEEL